MAEFQKELAEESKKDALLQDQINKIRDDNSKFFEGA